jgi:hypothetical protein
MSDTKTLTYKQWVDSIEGKGSEHGYITYVKEKEREEKRERFNKMSKAEQHKHIDDLYNKGEISRSIAADMRKKLGARPQSEPADVKEIQDEIILSNENVKNDFNPAALTAVAGIIRFVGWLNIAIGIAITLYLLTDGGGIGAFAFAIGGAIAGVIIIAFAELILTIVQIEKNTRKT